MMRRTCTAVAAVMLVGASPALASTVSARHSDEPVNVVCNPDEDYCPTTGGGHQGGTSDGRPPPNGHGSEGKANEAATPVELTEEQWIEILDRAWACGPAPGTPGALTGTPEMVPAWQAKRDQYGCDAAAGPGLTPGRIAEAVAARVAGRLPDPEILSNPTPGVPSIINVPVFVEVLNWQDEFTDSGCSPGGALCITVTATPQLTFDPGEAGSTPVECQGAGSRYDPDSDLEPDEQAVGACAYTYRKRTGTAGRPKAWPGRAIVTWTLRWTATNGDGDDLPDVTKVAELPKSVVEVQSLLVEPPSS
jgi:hypothetical protein